MTDAVLVVALAAGVALLLGLFHPLTRPWVLAGGRWLIAGLAAALTVAALVGLARRKPGSGKGTTTPPKPVAPDPVSVVRSYTARIEADKAHNERVVDAQTLADEANLAELLRLEAEARARAGLPPVR